MSNTVVEGTEDMHAQSEVAGIEMLVNLREAGRVDEVILPMEDVYRFDNEWRRYLGGEFEDLSEDDLSEWLKEG